MMHPAQRRQHGVALPVMLIIMVIMLISSIYLLKASNNSTLSAANMAYDSALSRAADLGLHKGFQYLQAKSLANKQLLWADDAANGYLASYDTTQAVTSSAFWANAVTVKNTAAQNGTGADDVVQYVVHRACLNAGSYAVSNACVMTSANPFSATATTAYGASQSSNGAVYNAAPQIHYIITARIFGPRGGNVVNQLVVLIDA
jgi:Tfp pilus assembly protein PilX